MEIDYCIILVLYLKSIILNSIAFVDLGNGVEAFEWLVCLEGLEMLSFFVFFLFFSFFFFFFFIIIFIFFLMMINYYIILVLFLKSIILNNITFVDLRNSLEEFE